jgi:hypothetical protein
MSDSEKVHRWLTQAELDEMLRQARVDAAQRALDEARRVAWAHGQNQVLDIAINMIDPFKVGL